MNKKLIALPVGIFVAVLWIIIGFPIIAETEVAQTQTDEIQITEESTSVETSNNSDNIFSMEQYLELKELYAESVRDKQELQELGILGTISLPKIKISDEEFSDMMDESYVSCVKLFSNDPDEMTECFTLMDNALPEAYETETNEIEDRDIPTTIQEKANEFLQAVYDQAEDDCYETSAGYERILSFCLEGIEDQRKYAAILADKSLTQEQRDQAGLDFLDEIIETHTDLCYDMYSDDKKYLESCLEGAEILRSDLIDDAENEGI